MGRVLPFELHAGRYDHWFERHPALYRSELEALRQCVLPHGSSLEVGVGSGRFAAPLGVTLGIDPSAAMLARAGRRGVRVVRAVAEALPFRAGSFDQVLIVTTLCFVDSPQKMLSEARRVLVPGGRLVLGFIDASSPAGQDYQSRRYRSPFYRDATFYSAAQVEQLLQGQTFQVEHWWQTLLRPLSEITVPEDARPGHGQGAFLVVCARKPALALEALADHVDFT